MRLTFMSPTARLKTVQQLAAQLRCLERAARSARSTREIISTGILALDNWLPEKGLPRGAVLEWLPLAAGSGAGRLAVMMAARRMGPDGTLVMIDPQRRFYPPALAQMGVDLERTFLVYPANARDTLWAFEQSLRCPAVAATVGPLDQITSHDFRRLQLAAEAGGGWGMLLRAARYRDQPSWADVRLLVEPLGSTDVPAERHLRIELLHARGGASSGTLRLGIDDETGTVRLVSELAAAKTLSCAAGA